MGTDTCSGQGKKEQSVVEGRALAGTWQQTSCRRYSYSSTMYLEQGSGGWILPAARGEACQEGPSLLTITRGNNQEKRIRDTVV